MGLDLAAQGDELGAVPAQEATLLFFRRGFADDAAARGVAVEGAVGDQPGDGGGVAGVGFAPAGERLGGEGQGLGADLSLPGSDDARFLLHPSNRTGRHGTCAHRHFSAHH